MKQFLMLFTLLFLIGCTTLYHPVQSESVMISENFAVLQEDDFTLAIQYKIWDKDPQELSDYFTSFYISLKNTGSEPLEIKESDFFLVDAEGVQYDAVDIDTIMDLLIPEEIYFQQFSITELAENTILEEWRDARSNLLKYAFNFGKIISNNRKEGYLFFQKLSLKNQQCSIYFRDKEITFRKMN